jgi:hypothetical protein
MQVTVSYFPERLSRSAVSKVTDPLSFCRSKVHGLGFFLVHVATLQGLGFGFFGFFSGAWCYIAGSRVEG